jgi:hypothetical protein
MMRLIPGGRVAERPLRQIVASAVAIPVRNEAAAIGPCLRALFAQSEPPDHILLLLNNCTDDTESVVRALAPDCPSALRIIPCRLSPEHSNAGHARARAMDLAAALAGPRGAVLTTDADGRVPPDWLARNLGALRRGMDLVCGMASIDPKDERALRPQLVEDDAREAEYTRLLDEIDSVIDPNPDDPWPRHTQHSGASLALTVASYRAIGGMPRIAMGEDRALVEAAVRHDLRIRHDAAIDVVVSGRMVGRAEGGMATTIARRMIQQDEWADDRLEPVAAAIARSKFRSETRRLWADGLDAASLLRLAASLAMPPGILGNALRRTRFGAAWGTIEAASPMLRRQPVAMAELSSLIPQARAALGLAKARADVGEPEDMVAA